MACFHKEKLGNLHAVVASAADAFDDETQMAKLLAYVSAWSYSDRNTFIDKLKQKPCLQGGDFVEVSVVNDAMFVVAHAYIIRTRDRRRAIVSFRGTEIDRVVNWLTDAGTRKVERFDGVEVHSGFYRNWKEVWQGSRGVEAHLLEPSKLSADYTGYDCAATPSPAESDEQVDLAEIYLTGHSLGGAMTIMAGLCLHQKRRENDLWSKLETIYTYGQPMAVGCGESRSVCQNRIGHKVKRYIYFNDIVPHLPPLTTGAFDHVGDEFKYMPESTLLPWPHKGEWRLRGGHLVDNVIRPRTTQVFTFLGALPFALGDFLFYNVQWASKIKSPWSLNDHNPYFYVDSFEPDHPEQENSCLLL